jgi:hypothetical protein
MNRIGLLAALAAASAWAQSAKAVIAVDGCSDGSTGQLARQLRDELRSRANGSGVQSEEDSAKPFGGLPRASLADTERLISSARSYSP